MGFDTKKIIESQSTVEKPRSLAELTARYHLKCNEYKDLKIKSDNSPGKREQLAMLYAEAKVLGWAIGKSEKTIIKEVTA